MRYKEIVTPETAKPRSPSDRPSMRSLMDRVRDFHAAQIRPEIIVQFGDDARAEMPFEIECPGLTVQVLGQAFAEAFQGRRLWCRQHCRHKFSVEPIRESKGKDTGRRFRFADPADAARFRQHWG